MQSLIATIVPGAALLLTPLAQPQPTEGVQLATRYDQIEVVQVTREVTFGLEITAVELEVDGERREGMDRMRGGSSTSLRSVHKDDILQVDDQGIPKHIRRSFGGITSKRTRAEGSEEELDASPREPQDGLILDIQVTEEGQKIKVVEGEAPENEAFLAQQPMVFAIEGLLPKEAVELEGTWDLESEAIRRALGSWSPAPRPRPEGEWRRRGGGDDRVTQEGRRRQGFRRMGGDMRGFLRSAEWEGQATLVSLESEWEGTKYALIEFEMRTEGEMPEPERGERGGRRRGGDREANAAIEPKAPEADAEILVKGKLYFDVEAGRPVAVQMKGEIGTTFSSSTERGERQISMYMEQEGEVELTFQFAYETR